MNSGCYQLKIRVKNNISLKIGALGVCNFTKGIYVYTGSAMKNLRQRIVRHKRKDKKLHWHIDHLLAHPEVELLETIKYPSEIKEECLHNQIMIKNRAEIPILGFGSSDCKRCLSHLIRVNALTSD